VLLWLTALGSGKGCPTMAEKKRTSPNRKSKTEGTARREFLNTVGKAAATAPAVALLAAASAKPAAAGYRVDRQKPRDRPVWPPKNPK
jgi:hypothetical protein